VKQLLLAAVALAVSAPACFAEWGWPPPNYSTTGVRVCDGYHYRGLFAHFREWRQARKGGAVGPNHPNAPLAMTPLGGPPPGLTPALPTPPPRPPIPAPGPPIPEGNP